MAAAPEATQVPPEPAPAPSPPPPAYAAPAAATVPVFANGKPMLDALGNPVSDKSRLAAALLCWFVGVLGVHRFYVGKTGTGIAMLVTCGGLGVWALIDLIVILVGSFRDSTGKALQNW
jgi:TM2 domain-containing membrane protein YozV